jgi:hypothetical protein
MIPETVRQVAEVEGATGTFSSAVTFPLAPGLQIQSIGLCSIALQVQTYEFKSVKRNYATGGPGD